MRTLSLPKLALPKLVSHPVLAAAGLALLVASPVTTSATAAPFSNAAKPAAAVAPEVQSVHYRSFGYRTFYRPSVLFYSYSVPRYYSFSGHHHSRYCRHY